MKKVFRLATRGSPLALIQAKMTAGYLSARLPGVSFEIKEYKTLGDKKQNWSLSKLERVGLFTKELEEALFNDEADIAVHSAKDLPVNLPENFGVAMCLPRDKSCDVLVRKSEKSVPDLIATSSPRRRAQLKNMFPNAVWGEMRGNVETRLKKLSAVESSIDATVLSGAGLVRLGITAFEDLVFTELKYNCCVPAAGQGIIALQCNDSLAEILSGLGDKNAMEAFLLERQFLRTLGGGCQVAHAANFDGEFFRIFHENCGIQKYKFSSSSIDEMLKEVEALAQGIVK